MRSLPESLRITPREAVLLVVLTVALPVAFAELYARVPFASEPWLRAAGANSLLLAVVATLSWTRGELKSLLTAGLKVAYIPALVIGGGALLLAFCSRLFVPGAGEMSPSSTTWAWIIWVPVVEEAVFRVGICGAFNRITSPVWAVWFSALTFAMAHTQPTLDHLERLGVPIGPFLLGILTGALYVRFKRFWPVVALHAVCNATPLIFEALDGRWLGWLGFLYH